MTGRRAGLCAGTGMAGGGFRGFGARRGGGRGRGLSWRNGGETGIASELESLTRRLEQLEAKEKER